MIKKDTRQSISIMERSSSLSFRVSYPLALLSIMHVFKDQGLRKQKNRTHYLSMTFFPLSMGTMDSCPPGNDCLRGSIIAMRSMVMAIAATSE